MRAYAACPGFSFGLVVLLLLIGSLYCCAQTPRIVPHRDAAVFHVSTDYVLIDALALNRRTGEPIGDLTAADFRLLEDGRAQQISYFSHDEMPLSVVFLFDLTDTVRSALQNLASQAGQVLNHLKPRDEVAVMVFSSHADLLQDFTTDRALAAAALRNASGMKTPEATFIFEDVYEAAQQAMQATIPGSRRVLIFFTDGSANFDSPLTRRLSKTAPVRLHTHAEATEELLRSGAVVSALIEKTALTNTMVAMNANPIVLAMGIGSRMGDVRHYAEQTGGPVLHTSKREAPQRLADLIDQIRNRYTLGYKPSLARPDGTFCRIRLQLNAATVDNIARKRIALRTRTGYYR